ncbi:TrlF family AAA-like ATPase [Bacillus alkalicellulosilyticus]|uniref:TrlF family AAA-like ATPase n=1 Tax=Alkalihalobacterium alkalicellulosilyticum TaxID=1912214 RepID=UPI000995FDBA|nr:AAA family ATPase [Bacillus alkalicellulosilyticus]
MFNGMEWLKCDLQMQTPGDPHNWVRTCDAYIGSTYTEEQLNQSVDLYLKRCHAVGLNVIGVTDHNFIGKEYLKRLIERNQEVARDLDREPLVIFPGFEVEIAQGLGVHVLCLFETNTPLDVIDEMVTELGLPNRRRVINGSITPLNKNFNNIITFIQEHKDYPGIVVAAHPLAESGMLNDSFMTDHFQREMFKDPRLLVMETPRVIESLPRGIKKIILSSDDCHEHWKRDRAIATVMSSDCYSLEESDKGFIGKRHSWIQFSKPSIDSLRQAFIDHSSRIKLQVSSPNEGNNYGKITSLEIRDVSFLDNQTINFSQNLNCIIGGRGSGKSSILEYIRLCTNSLSKFNEQLSRIENTLQQDSILKLTWQDPNGLIDVLHFSNGQVTIPSRTEVKDIDVIFKSLGINIYSQREITQMGQDSPSLMPLIDRISENELKEENNQEKEVAEKLISLIQSELKFLRLKEEKIELEQEFEELKRKWDTFTSVKEFSEKKKKVTLTRDFVSKVRSDKTAIDGSVEQLIDTLTTINEQYENMVLDSENLIKSEYINYIKEQFVQSIKSIKCDIQKTKEDLNNSLLSAIDNHDSWDSLKNEFDINEKEFEDACKAKGITEEEFELLKDTEQKLNRKDLEIEKKEEELTRTLELLKEKGNLHDRLNEIWKKQHEIRQTKINNLISIDTIPKVTVDGNDVPFLKIDIIYMGDFNHYMKLWMEFSIDGRSKLGRNWEFIGELAYSQFQQHNTTPSPWVIIQEWLENEAIIPSELNPFYKELKSHLNDHFEHWEKFRTKRIQDTIDITLYRADGTRAGSLLDNGLSDGQKNTAILTLLFTEGTGPIIIDQPEDELDSDFIYNELVPIIRKMKNKRQIILVSHNANLPVNGDAELIYALKTDVGKGKLRTEGGLDNPDVKRAILDIMEGSEEAFKRRSEKYSSY